MIFYFLISIVFLAEIIIGLFLIISLIKADRIVLKYDAIIDELKPSIKEVLVLVRKISYQLVELAPMVKNKIKSFIFDIIVGQAKNLLGALTFWLVKKEVEKHV